MRGNGIVGHRYWIAVVFFLLAAAPGAWIPVLSNVLKSRGWDTTITWAFVIGPCAGIISPLIFAARADQRIAAEKLLALLIGGGAVFLFAAFYALEKASSPTLFLVFLSINALISAPAWSLLTTVALTNLEDEQKSFGFYRLWGTLGWVAVGLMVSYLALDKSAEVGNIAAGVRVLAGISCLFLPHTPPKATERCGWSAALGLDALSVLRNPDHRVYIITTFALSVPLAAFYMHTPVHLDDLGFKSIAAGMTVGQIFEVVALVVMGVVLVRVRMKWICLFAIGCGVLRYGLYALGGISGSSGLILTGVALHGFCFIFFFETGRVFINRRVDVGIRAQVQALLTFASFGLGSLVGTILCGWLYDRMVLDEFGGWPIYWGTLSAMCAGAGLYFLIGYKGLKGTTPEVPEP